MFEICVISSSRRSSLLRHDTLYEARQTAQEAAAITGCRVEIVNRRTGDVVERHEPLTKRTATMGDQGQRAPRAQELRRKAAVARRAASVPTSGSGRVNRVLVVLAEQLERDAAILEQESNGC
jgi:metal-dependent amidase/aminoacylase/carboxypeptidase family protein